MSSDLTELQSLAATLSPAAVAEMLRVGRREQAAAAAQAAAQAAQAAHEAAQAAHEASRPEQVRTVRAALTAAFGSPDKALTRYFAGPAMSAEDPDQDAPRPHDQSLHKALVVLVGDTPYHVVVVGHCSLAMRARAPGTPWFEVESFSDH